MSAKEIGGYFELEPTWGEHYHTDAIRLNCGRGCIKYLAELRSIESIWLPDFMCDSVWRAFGRSGCMLNFYTVTHDFRPQYDFHMKPGEWLFVCDYYGQLSESDFVEAMTFSRGSLIIDETQAFFRVPKIDVDVMYTCRKWFGVADGGYVRSAGGETISRELPQDHSLDRMDFVLGRIEGSAGEYYERSSKNNDFFDNEPAKLMSPITDRIMSGIDYEKVQLRRIENWTYLSSRLGDLNEMEPILNTVPFMYPFKTAHSSSLRRVLIDQKIFVPKLWPNVITSDWSKTAAVDLAENIVPLPIDQRYELSDMERVAGVVERHLAGMK